MTSISATQARRIAIRSQLLDGDRPPSSPNAVHDVAKRLRCIQIDPINVVARTQLLVLWSRLSDLDVRHLDVLMWERKELFHYWAHAASLVVTDDYPLHKMRMRRFRDPATLWAGRYEEWLERNSDLRRRILGELRRRGPLRSRDIEGIPADAWTSSGWTSGQTVTRMLDLMWTRGEIMISGRDGRQRIWDLAERWFPGWTPKRALTRRQGYDRAAEIAFSCLGVATPRQVNAHFVRDGQPDLKGTVARLERKKAIAPIEVRNGATRVPGNWYIHRTAVPLLDEISDDSWRPRTTLLSPFDNLIADRKRTLALWDFDYKIEIYVPKAKRKYGYYSLPILNGDTLIGRIDAAADRKARVFRVLSVHAETGAPEGAGIEIGVTIQDLARFTGAGEISWPRDLPRPWARDLRSVEGG